jgi:hypothetical protein
MAELGPRRVFIDDVRGDGSRLRVTWHADRGVFVVSNWVGEVCTGATRVPRDAAPELIGLLVRGLADAPSADARTPDHRATPPTGDGWRWRLRDLVDRARSATRRVLGRVDDRRAADDLISSIPWRHEDRDAG